jgi:predicted ATP-grasp superfamily ATP-dependent carboligase
VEELIWTADAPELRSPALVCAFRGWNDAGGAATAALDFLGKQLGAEALAHIDPEEFFDFQDNRPMIHLDEGQTRRIEWPSNILYSCPAPGAERDLVLLDGTEPSLRWRSFSELLADAAAGLGVELIVTMGALIASVAHSMPVPVTGMASDPALVERLGLTRSNYEGPTGIVGVLHDACRRKGMTSASLWAAVPHYVAATPNPKAALALLRRLETVTGTSVDASELEEESSRFESQIDTAVAENPEVEEFVRGLAAEQEREAEEAGELPSGEAIARDFERFLRQRGEGGPQDPHG